MYCDSLIKVCLLIILQTIYGIFNVCSERSLCVKLWSVNLQYYSKNASLTNSDTSSFFIT